jgi:hypothetical protein
MGRVGLLAVREAKLLVPRQTGNLGRSIRLGRVTATRFELLAGGTSKVGYAAYVEFGTKAHVIVPRTKRILAWSANRRLSGSPRTRGGRPIGPMVFARRVNHPGTKPKPYLVPGARRALRKVGLGDEIVKVWNAAA